MRIQQAEELKKMGEKIEVKVTVAWVKNVPVVHIRDFEFSDFKRAALLLQHIQRTEDPTFHEGLIG